ncbi:hypothetical protein [Rubinisphaera margarita]|uniref:hypothetical protein n=1 Tax=Rubinisphaera margarita TaxID=2909586 RepID=UPI001EE8126C|nr:hypothetical protein [Rubinisphaera margarita]MCG6157796.1 hypothetical protein [Rubinisphaera margarita]
MTQPTRPVRFGLRAVAILLLLFPLLTPGHARAEESPAPEAPLKAAFAERDITPEIGMEQPGGYGKSYHRTLHDPCKVRIGVFSSGEGEQKNSAAVVSVDALIVRRAMVEAARARIAEATGIPGNRVLVHATHSHSSGPTGMILPGEFDHASQEVQDLAYEKSSMADAKYLQHVEDQIVDGVVTAWKQIGNARFAVGRGHEDTVAHNRRFLMKDGRTVTHPRPGNPDIVKVAGPTDPEVGVLAVWNDEGDLTGCIVNYVCHATASPGGISANYIYYVEKVIRGMFGEDVVVVFLAGASGDVTQVDNLTKTVPKSGEASSALVGGRIGAEAVKVILGLTPGTDCPIDGRQEVLKIPRREPRPQNLEQAKALVKQSPSDVGATEWTFAKETVLLEARLKSEPIADVEIQAIQIGPVAIATVPAEYFCEYGLQIKKGSPFPFTFVASLSNGCVGYVPTVSAFGDQGGGYETRLTSYSNLEITAGDEMAATAIKLTREMKPGSVPGPKPMPAFKGPAWSYGDILPQVD